MSNIPEIETERLILRAYHRDDFDQLADFFASSRAEYVGGQLDRAKVWSSFASDMGQWHLLGFGPWMIEEKQSGSSIGGVGINFPLDYPEHELGWILYDGFEGKGYALEAALAAREYAFNTLGWETIVSYIDPRNERSIRLAQKMGAIRDETAPTPNNDPCLVFRHMAKTESYSA